MNLSFFLTLAGLGISVAGFAALMSAVGGELSRVGAWRIRMIVTLAFRAAVLSLSVVAIDSLVDDGDLAVRVASLAAMVMVIDPMWGSHRDPEVFRSRGEKVFGFAFAILTLAIPVVANLFLVSHGLLMVIYIIVLIHPMSIFVAFTNEIYTPPPKVG